MPSLRCKLSLRSERTGGEPLVYREAIVMLTRPVTPLRGSTGRCENRRLPQITQRSAIRPLADSFCLVRSWPTCCARVELPNVAAIPGSALVHCTSRTNHVGQIADRWDRSSPGQSGSRGHICPLAFVPAPAWIMCLFLGVLPKTELRSPQQIGQSRCRSATKKSIGTRCSRFFPLARQAH